MHAYDQQCTILLKPDYFHGLAVSPRFPSCSARAAPLDDPLLPAVHEGLVSDAWAHKMMARLQDPSLPPVGRGGTGKLRGSGWVALLPRALIRS